MTTITAPSDIMSAKWTRRTPVKVVCMTAVAVCMVYIHFKSHGRPTYATTSPSNLSKQGFHFDSQKSNLLRIERVCEMIKKGYYEVPRYYNKTVTEPEAYVDHYHRVLTCVNAKAGSTSWVEMAKLMVEREKRERSEWFSQHPYPWYREKNGPLDRLKELREFGFNILSVGYDAHREVGDGLPDPRTDYFKFIQARHPLERLASGYMNRVRGLGDVINGQLHITKTSRFFTWTGKSITFEEYLSFVAKPDNELVRNFDRHWRTFHYECDPCSIKYDYVAHLETLDEELDDLQSVYNVTYLKSEFPVSNSNRFGKLQYATFYRDVPMSILQPVLDKYQVDADLFGYSFDDYIPNNNII